MGTGAFHYRLRRAVGGYRPGAHAASSLGAGQQVSGHARLFDVPDPRRIDVRASLRQVRRDWLVRTYRQRASTPVYALVDVSASMHFGGGVSKLQRVAQFAESVGHSAFIAGDPAGLLAFDAIERLDLYVPACHSRGVGSRMGASLRAMSLNHVGATRRQLTSAAGLQYAVGRLTGRQALIFLVSDFHWELDLLTSALDGLLNASVVPVVVWDPAELVPPADDGLLSLRDAETGVFRSFWIGRTMRERWLAQVARRRSALEQVFAARELRPFYMVDAFDPAALSQYFLETYV